jgi:IS605 OrfB family transposase
VTRIAFSKNINAGKYAALLEQARRLGLVRAEVWQRFGSLAGVGVSDRKIRDCWMQAGRAFGVSANAWKETLRDALDNIKAAREAAKQKVRQSIRRHTSDPDKQKRLYTTLKGNAWVDDLYLVRMMRKYWHRGHNHTYNQIVVRADNYRTFINNGKAWVAIPGLDKGKRICVPLNTSVAPSGTLKVILRDGCVEIHYAIDIEARTDCGNRTIGVDKGYTEVLVDSDGEHHGTELGKMLSNESDRLKTTYQRRAKLRSIAKKSDPGKTARIEKNNLGRKKLDNHSKTTKQQVRDVVFKAVHVVVDKACVVAAEDLSSPFVSGKFEKNTNRRLAAWTKGVIAEALDSVSRRRGSSVVLVNAAYTSQTDSKTGCLIGIRKGDRFYRETGEVLQADENAALNVLARLSDSEIGRYTPYRQVKRILQDRTKRHRLGLLNQDTSCTHLVSTVSELPDLARNG